MEEGDGEEVEVEVDGGAEEVGVVDGEGEKEEVGVVGDTTTGGTVESAGGTSIDLIFILSHDSTKLCNKLNRKSLLWAMQLNSHSTTVSPTHKTENCDP